jgi:hypothetical protein
MLGEEIATEQIEFSREFCTGPTGASCPSDKRTETPCSSFPPSAVVLAH